MRFHVSHDVAAPGTMSEVVSGRAISTSMPAMSGEEDVLDAVVAATETDAAACEDFFPLEAFASVS